MAELGPIENDNTYGRVPGDVGQSGRQNWI